ncbi:MAG: metal-sulfur cluster assembly factor [Corynebacterium sp.]|nr:metal-sulfur cluster assembly factor [Corynebacterium sp.]
MEDRSDRMDEIEELTKPPQSDDDLVRVGEIEDALHDVIDPELGINVVDLGLVYDMWVDGEKAVIEMTLTSPACPLTDMLEEQAEAAITSKLLATEVIVKWVWNPPWTPNMITDDGREQLRALGFSI